MIDSKLTLIKGFALATALSALILGGCGKSGSASGNVAVVNGEAISMDDYYNYLQRKPTMLVAGQQGQANAQLIGTPGFQAMRDLIISKVLGQMAKDDGVAPTDADVAKELKFHEKSDPNYVQARVKAGYTIEGVKQELRDQLCRFNIITKGIVATPADVDDYIKQHPATFMNPPLVKALMVLVKTDADKAKVDKDLAAGKPFKVVAKLYTADPNAAASDYHLRSQNLLQLPTPLQDLFNRTSENSSTDWVKSAEGFVKFFIEQKTKASPMVIDDTVKENVRRSIMQTRGAAAVDLDKRLVDKLKQIRDKITVTVPANADQWKQTLEQVIQAADASPGTGLGTAPAAPKN